MKLWSNVSPHAKNSNEESEEDNEDVNGSQLNHMSTIMESTNMSIDQGLPSAVA